MTFKERPFENIVRKGVNAGNQHFLLFPKCFLPFPKQILIFESRFFLSGNAFDLDQSENLLFGKEVSLYHVVLYLDHTEEEAFWMHQKERKISM